MVQFINISSCYSCIWFTSLIKDALCITICCILLVMYIYIFVFHLNILFMYNKCIDKITIIVSHILSIFYFNIIFPSCNNCNYTVKLFFLQPCLQRHISSGTSRISYLFGICNYFMDIDLFKFTFNCFHILS